MVELSEIRAKAIDYLARREYSRSELKQKLLVKFASHEDEIDQVLSLLADKNMQSDARYIESLIRHRANQGYGLLRIKQELNQHHIDRITLEKVLDELEIDWTEVAKALYVKRYGNQPIHDIKDKMKRSQYLYSHGFSQDEIKAAINTQYS